MVDLSIPIAIVMPVEIEGQVIEIGAWEETTLPA